MTTTETPDTPPWLADGDTCVVRYTLDENEVPLPAHRAMIGIGEYADQGEPDALVTLDCPYGGLEEMAGVVLIAIESWLASMRVGGES